MIFICWWNFVRLIKCYQKYCQIWRKCCNRIKKLLKFKIKWLKKTKIYFRVYIIFFINWQELFNFCVLKILFGIWVSLLKPRYAGLSENWTLEICTCCSTTWNYYLWRNFNMHKPPNWVRRPNPEDRINRKPKHRKNHNHTTK